MQFAERAILAQPFDYAKTVGEGVFLTFFATDRSQAYLSDHFTVAPHVTTLAPYMKSDEHRYAHTTSNTHVVQPWAFFMFLYQLPVWFPGWVFFGVVVAGLVAADPAMARLGPVRGPGLGRGGRQPGGADRGARARLPVRAVRGSVRLPGARPGVHPPASARAAAALADEPTPTAPAPAAEPAA